MRYSVVLPRVDPADSGEARSALEQARVLWDTGDQRAALDQVRKAVEAATLADQRDRALTLERALAALTRALEGGGPASGAVSGDKTRAVKAAASAVRTVAPARKTSVPKIPAQKRTSRPPGPRKTSAPKMAAAAKASAPAVGITVPAPAVAITAPAPAVAITPAPAAFDEVPEAEERELVVTIASSDWALSTPDALVGHSAVRVAIAPGRGPGGTVVVRPLSAGEVAPVGASIALLVALEPGSSPLPRVKS